MKRLIGKSLGNVVFTEQNGNLYGNLTNYGVNASYLISPVDFCGPAKAILMDLDGTTLTSEEFWIFVIEQTMQNCLEPTSFRWRKPIFRLFRDLQRSIISIIVLTNIRPIKI